MSEKRPNPDYLLRQLSNIESEQKRGKLKIFFGYAAGVGKTFAMLEAAHEAKSTGLDVIAGYIEPHTRPETLSLLEGLEILPPLQITYKGISLNEFDLDTAIRRNPKIVLVDELAHTNADGCRHLKRYQDVEELLKAGINVYTTVNVQHIESLNDIVASITSVVVQERIPDSVFDSADQVELVDIEPDDLIDRLHKGKIYRERQAQRALGNFFTKENLVALREIALRRTADRVNKAVEKSRTLAQKNEYFTGEHILICLSSSPSNSKVIRTAARMADAFHGTFTALFVETPRTKELTPAIRSRLRENLKLAEQLGARIATVYGEDVPEQIAEYAKASGISKIVIGRSNNKKMWFFQKQNFIERLTTLAPNLDIYVIPDSHPPYSAKLKRKLNSPKLSLLDTLKSIAILALATGLGYWFYHLGFSEANIITVYILGVLFTAIATQGKLYSTVSSFVSVVIFNFFFTHPRFSFEAYDPSYAVTFLIMFISAFITSTLTKRIKEQARQSALKAYRTEVLLETSQKLQRAKNAKEILDETAHQMIKLLDRTVIIYPADENKLGQPIVFRKNDDTNETQLYIDPSEQAVAEWVYKNNKHAGATTNTLPASKCLYLAVRSLDTAFAVAAIAIETDFDLDTFEKNLLLAILGECALALEKEKINETKNQISLLAEQEKLRANLLRAISHDLRTPLTCISGDAGILMNNSSILDDAKKMQLYTDIYDDSMWLINLVENLLAVTRIDNGSMNISMESELLDEIIIEALHHINRKSCEHTIGVIHENDMLMAKMDSRLIVQVIINIVDNAIKYTKPGSHITISTKQRGKMALIEVADDGDGITEDVKEKLFDMFFTSNNTKGDERRGLGLGLSLCKSIIMAHGGTISVNNNTPHGTVFCFTLEVKEVNSN